MQKVNLKMLVQYQILKMGTKLSNQTKAKLRYLTLLLKRHSGKKTMHYQLLNQSVMQISAKLFFLKANIKRNCSI